MPWERWAPAPCLIKGIPWYVKIYWPRSGIVQANAALSFGAMIQEHERDMSFWQTEWSYIPQICIMLDGAIAMLKIILENMIVHEDRIRKNLYMTKGLIVSERLC